MNYRDCLIKLNKGRKAFFSKFALNSFYRYVIYGSDGEPLRLNNGIDMLSYSGHSEIEPTIILLRCDETAWKEIGAFPWEDEELLEEGKGPEELYAKVRLDPVKKASYREYLALDIEKVSVVEKAILEKEKDPMIADSVEIVEDIQTVGVYFDIKVRL